MKNLPLAILGLVTLCGCAAGSSSNDAPAKPLAAEQEMKHIQDNPNMPPEAKAQAQAALSKGQAMGDAMKSHPQK